MSDKPGWCAVYGRTADGKILKIINDPSTGSYEWIKFSEECMPRLVIRTRAEKIKANPSVGRGGDHGVVEVDIQELELPFSGDNTPENVEILRFENTRDGRLALLLHITSLSNRTRDAIERRINEMKEESELLMKWAHFGTLKDHSPLADRISAEINRVAAAWHHVVCVLIYKSPVADYSIRSDVWAKVLDIVADEQRKHETRLQEAREHFNR